MFKGFKKAIKEQNRRDKISKSLEKYHAEHGCTRRVPVNYGEETAFIYMPKTVGFK